MMDIKMNVPASIISVKPIGLPAENDRGEELQVRVTAPVIGQDLPIIVFSHGFGWSMDGYAPLVDFWAAHGLRSYSTDPSRFKNVEHSI